MFDESIELIRPLTIFSTESNCLYSINKYKIQTLVRIVVLNSPCLWQYSIWYLNPTFGLNSCQLWSLLEILHSAKKSGNTSCFAGSESISKPTFSTLLDMILGVGDVCFFLTMRCFNDAMFSNS